MLLLLMTVLVKIIAYLNWSPYLIVVPVLYSLLFKVDFANYA